MTLILLRHAHAGSRRAWVGDDRERPLSDKGQQQAEAVASRLERLAPVRILSSPTVRCRQTVVPLGRRLELDVTDDDRLFEGAGRDDVRSVIDEVKRDTVVLCSHGDVIPELLRELLDRGMTHRDPLVWQKASAWIVERDGDNWGAATYLRPPR